MVEKPKILLEHSIFRICVKREYFPWSITKCIPKTELKKLPDLKLTAIFPEHKHTYRTFVTMETLSQLSH